MNARLLVAAAAAAILTVIPAAASAESGTYANPAAVTVAQDQTVSSSITVSGLPGSITAATVTLKGFNAPTAGGAKPVHALLVGPTGAKTTLLGGAGDAGSVGTNPAGADIILSQTAAAMIPCSGSLTAGTYKPRECDQANAVYGVPAPAGPYPADLGVFNTTAPTGTWTLYMAFRGASGGASFQNGWTLSLATDAPPPDADGDGIPNASDACPSESDASAPRDPRTGCPAPPAAPPPDPGTPQPGNPQPPAPGPSVTPDLAAPVLSAFTLSPSKFVAANSGPSVVSAAVGTRVFYRLSEAATVTLTVERRTTGVKKGSRCVAGRPRKGKKPCTRYVAVKGEVTRTDPAGLTGFRFMGRLGRKSLVPGSYRLNVVARDAVGNTSKIARKPFTILRAR